MDMSELHKMPLHLETEDKFLWSLTGRQCFIIASGLTIGYLAFGDIITVITPLTLVVGIVLWVLFAAASAVVALVRVKHRNLEQWAIVSLLYWSRSHYYLWRPVLEENEQDIELEETYQLEEKGFTRW